MLTRPVYGSYCKFRTERLTRRGSGMLSYPQKMLMSQHKELPRKGVENLLGATWHLILAESKVYVYLVLALAVQ